MVYNLYFFSSKCRLFHNATLFGFCITHILNTGCAKIEKKSVTKRLIRMSYATYSKVRICTDKEAGWAPEPVCLLWRRSGSRTMIDEQPNP